VGVGRGWSLSQQEDTVHFVHIIIEYRIFIEYNTVVLTAFFLYGCSFFLRSLRSRSTYRYSDSDLPGDFRTERGIFSFNSARNKVPDTTLQGRLRFKKRIMRAHITGINQL
jgi:hypothetical protein